MSAPAVIMSATARNSTRVLLNERKVGNRKYEMITKRLPQKPTMANEEKLVLFIVSAL